MVTLRIHFAEIIQYLAYGNSSWKSTRPRLWPKTWNTAPVGHICTHLHMQMNLTVQLLAYNPLCGDAKGRHGSFHLWTETAWSIINTCQTPSTLERSHSWQTGIQMYGLLTWGIAIIAIIAGIPQDCLHGLSLRPDPLCYLSSVFFINFVMIDWLS